MEPVRNTNATLVDLLDRILDKGLVIYADVIVSVAGIPLIGVNLRAALAGMETMLKYGVMMDWDEKSRAWESEFGSCGREHRKKKSAGSCGVVPLIEGEEIILKMLGSYRDTEGIYSTWRPGLLYLTDKRLYLYQKDLNEILFQTPLEEIKAMAMKKEADFTKEPVDVLYLLVRPQGTSQDPEVGEVVDNRVERLRAVDIYRLKEAIEERIKIKGLTLDDNLAVSEFGRRCSKR
ncbi:MAG: gas vesicle protein [candidate division Zixibacteria bacterium]|nr:gas vesicle protein [candidate division Zixibacteria bacterium]